MPEIPAPRATPESSPRVESRPERGTAINAFNNIFKKYSEAMSPLLARLEAGENLSNEERRDANAYRVTRDGVNNTVSREYRPDQPAIPDDLSSDEWTNVYKDPDGKVVGKQQEGIPTNHMLKWIDGEIAKQGEHPNAADLMSRDMLRASSGTYAELHSTPGSIDRETRVRQEAGAIIHPDPTRDSRISQDNETDRAAHERDDWQMASDEIDERTELVLPPLKTEGSSFVNVPKVVVDDTAEPKRVHVPDHDDVKPPYEPRPVLSGGIIDLGGGTVTLPVGGEITSDYIVPVGRSIPDRLAAPAEPHPMDTDLPGTLPGTIDEGDEFKRLKEDVDGKLKAAGLPPSDEKPFDSLDDSAGSGVEPGDPGFRFGMPPRRDGEDSGDRSGAFYPIGDPRRESAPTEGAESTEGPEDAAEKAAGARGERLAKTGLARRLWDRARDFVGRSAPDDDWLAPRVDAPLKPGYTGKRVGRWIALALVVAAVVATCARPGAGGPQASSGAEPFPGNQYPKMEQVVDRPQMTTPLPAEEAAAVIAPEQKQPAPPAAEVKPAGGFEGGGGRSIATSEHDFSMAGEKQSLKGETEDLLAQLVSPEYKAYVDKMKSEGKVVDAAQGGSKDVLDKFKAKLVEQFGDQAGQEKYDKILKGLTEQQRYVLENLNGPGGSKVGIGEDGDAIIRGPEWDGKLRLVDMSRDSDGFMTVISGITGKGYSSLDAGVLDQYTVGFTPGGNP